MKIKWVSMKVVGVVGAVGDSPRTPEGGQAKKEMGGASCTGDLWVVGVLEETRRGSEKTQSFFLNSFSHLAMISASGIVFKKPLANKKLKLS